MSGSAYVPPHLRNAQGSTGGNTAQAPQARFNFRQTQNQYPNRGNVSRDRSGNISRSQSVPIRLSEVADSEVEQRFAMNQETTDMSVYEDAEVIVHSDQQLEPITQFPGCGIRNEILMSVAQIGFKLPTAVQKYAIPYVLAHHDVLVTSQTGSGKTAAYMLPVISQVIQQPIGKDPVVVVLVPTRELALQIQTETNKFTNATQLKTVCIYGGASFDNQIRQLHSCNILIATPGRLIDMMNKGYVTLRDVKYLVLDEADRMLDMGFEPQIDEVINGFDMPNPDNRQALLFSATFPREVQELARKFMKPNVTRIEVGMQDAPSLIQQRFVYVPENYKLSSLKDAISEVDGQTLVFAERKVRVDSTEEFLYDEGYPVVAIHGDRDMTNRRAALRGFSKGRAKIMIATDVAARGIDIPSVTHVINMDLPTDVDSYIHRIGRTGRAGKHGIATSFWNEMNTSFLVSLLNHFKDNHQPIPEGLEQFEKENRHLISGNRGRGHNGRRSNFPRDKSYNNVSKKYF